MISKYRSNQKVRSILSGTIFGTLTSLIIISISVLLLSKLIQNNTIPQENIGFGIMLIILIASFAGTLRAEKMVKRRKIMVCIITCIEILLALFIIAYSFFGGITSGFTPTALLTACGGVLTLFLPETKRTERRGNFVKNTQKKTR